MAGGGAGLEVGQGLTVGMAGAGEFANKCAVEEELATNCADSREFATKGAVSG